MIIMEGPDGSGKTTTIRRLAPLVKMIPAPHSGGPIENRDALYARINEQLYHYGKILDRSSIFSEPVYGVAVRGHSLMDLSEFERWVHRLIQEDWRVVWCTAEGRIEEGKRWKSQAHMQAVVQHRTRIHQMYGSVMRRAADLGLRIIQFNWEDASGDDKQMDFLYNKLAWMVS
jgi:hypothetical protein